jgi:uncharacterized RDD family membrane protein YckC
LPASTCSRFHSEPCSLTNASRSKGLHNPGDDAEPTGQRHCPRDPRSTPGTPGDALVDTGQARILTGEAVHLDVRVARIGSRALARLIDAFLQIVLLVALVLLFVLAATFLAAMHLIALDDALASTLVTVSVVLALIGYPVLLETTTRGRTLGKMMIGLRVVRDDGGPVTFRHALTRTLVALAIEWPGVLGAPITWLATIWTMIASPQGKRLGDHVAGTMVIHERTPAAWGWVPQMPPELAQWAATLDLAALDDDLALAVRHFLARNRGIREPARTRLGHRLAQEVAAVTNPPRPRHPGLEVPGRGARRAPPPGGAPTRRRTVAGGHGVARPRGRDGGPTPAPTKVPLSRPRSER